MLRSLLGLGLIGYSKRNLHMHRDGYIQRFLFDMLPDAADVNADYFFVHPATKEWIRRHESYTWASTNWQSRLLIGDSLPYESKVPRVRLAMEHYGLVIYVNGKLATTPGGKTKDSTILPVPVTLALEEEERTTNLSA